jgi:branched-chain amino acid transport system ATP-binding protein
MTEPLLQVEGLSKAFGAVVAGDGVTLDLEPGELHAVIGPNGAGKTTLIGQLAGEIRPDAGTIRFRGEEVTGLPTHARAARGLARSFQITSLFPRFTARDNVALAVQAGSGHSFGFWRPVARDQDLNDAAARILSQVGLEDRASVPAAALAHGEQRQLEIAMALAGRPRLLLLDEPTAGMGREDSLDMIDLLAGLKGEIAMLLIEHDMDVVFALADRISVLVYGRVIATGRPDEIRADGEVRRAYLGEEV